MYTWIRDRVAPVERGVSMQRRHRSQGVLRPQWRARSEYSIPTRNVIVIKLVEFFLNLEMGKCVFCGKCSNNKENTTVHK